MPSSPAARLSDADVERYSRQLVLDGVGERGQQLLAAARVVVVGAGALGSPVIAYLAGAGAGSIEVWDGDQVESSNLSRQPLHGEGDLGRAKAESAAAAARRLNGAITVEAHRARLEPGAMRDAVRGRTVVCDATDDMATKFALNDACVAEGVPLVHAAVLEYGGQLTTIVPDGACLRCLFGEPPGPDEVPTCAQAGILGPVAGVLGAMQAAEALKVALGLGEPLSGRLLVYDALRPKARIVDFPRDPACPAPHTTAHGGRPHE